MPGFDPFVLAPAAFLAGVLMFLAPCTLPIVPGYLAFIAGGNGRGAMVKNALAFVLGFSIVFILLGLFASFIGHLLGPWRDILSRAAGVIIIIFGLTMLGLFRIPVFSNTVTIRAPKFLTLGHHYSSLLIGALFALGWSPCIGPILGSVLFVASTSATAVQGAILLAIFSLGLGLPFVLSAIFMEHIAGWFARAGTVTAILSYLGGVILIFIGILMTLGDMGLLVTWGFGAFSSWGYQSILNYL